MGGAFQTSRDIFEHPIWQDVTKFRIFFFIVGNAVFSKEGTLIGGIHVKRGQFLRSYRNLQEDLSYIENRSLKKYSLSVIKRKIDQLVKEHRLKLEESELGTLFTVVNYDLYQGLDNYKKSNLERSENGERTPEERSENNNKNVKECFKNDLKDSTTTVDMPAPKEYNFYSTFQRAFGRVPTPLQSQDICNYIEQDGLEERLICYGLEKASKAGKDYGYAARIFGIWKSKGILTYDAGVKEQEEFERQKATQQPKKNIKKDKLPEWIQEQEKQTEHPDQAKNTDEKKRKRMEALLKSLGEWDEDKERGYG